MKKLFITVAALGIFCAVWAQENVKVIAEGRGDTQEQAVAQAKMNALDAVCGTILKETSLVMTDEIKSELSTYTNGFVIGYRIVSPYQNKTVKIEAVVARDQVREWGGARTALVPVSAGVQTQNTSESDYEKRKRDYSNLLVALMGDYSLIHQIVIRGEKQMIQYEKSPALLVNFDLVINPVDYRRYFANLERNFSRMGMKPNASREKAPRVRFQPVPASKEQSCWSINPLWLDLGVFKSLKGLHLRVRIDALDDNGEVLAKKDFYLNLDLFDATQTANMIVTFQLPQNGSLSRKGWVALPLANPDDVQKVSYYTVRIGTYDLGKRSEKVPQLRMRDQYYGEK